MVAYRLVELIGRASAANILGITVSELDKLVEVFELSEKFTGLRDPSARHHLGARADGRQQEAADAERHRRRRRKRSTSKRITNSKDLRKLRAILPDPVAREHFLSEEGDLDSAMLRLGPAPRRRQGLPAISKRRLMPMKHVPWTALAELKGDQEILKKIDEAEALFKSLRKTLSS